MKEAVLPLKQLVADPNQPRQEFDPKQLNLLAQSIKQKGILVPISVEETGSGKYLVIDGERRFRAATQLKLEKVPVFIHKAMGEVERLSLRFHLQEQHSNWSEFDKARAIASMSKNSGMSSTELGELLGIDATTISEYVALLTLSKRMQVYADKRRLNFKLVSKITRLKKAVEDPELKRKIEDAIIDKFEDGIIENAYHVGSFIASVKFLQDQPAEQEKLIKKIINDKNYTPLQATKDSGRGDYLSQQEVLSSCTEIKLFIRRIHKAKTSYALTAKQAQHISETLHALSEYVENAKEA